MATRFVDLVLDSFAWVEYLKGQPAGRVVDRALHSGGCGTPIHVLAEISDKYHRERQPGLGRALDFIELRTTILPMTRGVAERAGKTKTDRRVVVADFPLADAIILETAREFGSDLLTGDPHFRGIHGVQFLPSR